MEKTLILGKTEDKRRRGRQKMRGLHSITDSTDMNLSKLGDRTVEPGNVQSTGSKSIRCN